MSQKIYFSHHKRRPWGDLLTFFAVWEGKRKEQIFAKQKKNKMAIFAHDAIGRHINFFGVYEEEDLEFIIYCLSLMDFDISKKNILDIGANIGNHSIYFASKFKSVIAFEPNPDAFVLLTFNTRKNSNIELKNYGLGDEAGEFTMIDVPGNIGASTIIAKTTQIPDSVIAKIKTLDSLSLGTVDFMKIDVEGFEEKVLIGARETIKKNSPIILLEQLKTDFKNSTSAAIELLRNQDYKIFWIDGQLNLSQNIFYKFLKLLKSVFFGRILTLCSGSEIPERNHSLLIAIPKKLL